MKLLYSQVRSVQQKEVLVQGLMPCCCQEQCEHMAQFHSAFSTTSVSDNPLELQATTTTEDEKMLPSK